MNKDSKTNIFKKKNKINQLNINETNNNYLIKKINRKK